MNEMHLKVGFAKTKKKKQWMGKNLKENLSDISYIPKKHI